MLTGLLNVKWSSYCCDTCFSEHILLGDWAEGTEEWMVLQTAESVEDTAVADHGPPSASGAIPQRLASWAACLCALLCFSLNEMVLLKQQGLKLAEWTRQ